MISNENINWIRKLTVPERDKGFSRTFYSYPAKFLSKLPRGLIKRFTKEGDIVLDPFVGGGTTGLEAMLLNRRFIGYDINAFGIFISNVKTTMIDTKNLETSLKSIISIQKKIKRPNIEVLDEDDRICLGIDISFEINSLVESISLIDDPTNKIKNFFRLALIHTVKISGRRDFEKRKDEDNISIVSMFIKKSKKMIRGMRSFQKDYKYQPEFVLAPNHHLKLLNSSIDLIITSPPYKDKDIEYQDIQIQRRSLKRSKRSNFALNILNTKPLSRKDLCWTGKSGEVYWNNNIRSLDESFRVLKPNKLAFFWIGFKDKEDYKTYEIQINKVGFTLIDVLEVQLSHDRSASGRSTHHGRKTGMMTLDYLFIAKK